MFFKIVLFLERFEDIWEVKLIVFKLFLIFLFRELLFIFDLYFYKLFFFLCVFGKYVKWENGI